MEQLPLEVRLADHAVFLNFHAAGNEPLVHALQSAARGARPEADRDVSRRPVWLWGPPGSGRTHLLQASVALASEAGRATSHVALRGDPDLEPPALDAVDGTGLVTLDDVHAVAGDPDWERALFRLFERTRDAGGNLVVSAAMAPTAAGIKLVDLSSRLVSGLIFRVRPLDDPGLLEALRLRARFRGFDLPDETGRFLLARESRAPADLFRLLDELDRAGLAAQKRLTIPFVSQVIDGARLR